MKATARPIIASAAVVAVGTALGVAVPANAYQRPGVSELVSVSSSGVQGNGDSGESAADNGYVGAGVVMTPDGRYVAFTSAASNLVPGDIDGGNDVFVRDRKTGVTTTASVSSDGSFGVLPPTGGVSCRGAYSPAISADGRYVAFTSCYLELVARVVSIAPQIYLRDTRRGTTTLVSVARGGAPGNGGSNQATISADGSRVAFSSYATNLDPKTCPDDTSEATLLCNSAAGGLLIGGVQQVFVRDRRRPTTKVVSVASNGDLADGPSMYPAISADGQFVAFTSYADNLAANDANAQCTLQLVGQAPSCPDVYLRDLGPGRTELVSVGLDGKAVGNSNTYSGAAISHDDRYVAFESTGSTLVPNADGWTLGIYVRDRKMRRTERATLDSTGTPIQVGVPDYSLSSNGRFVVMHNAPVPECHASDSYQIGLYDLVTGAWDIVDRRDASGRIGNCPTQHLSFYPQISADGRYVAFASNNSTLVRTDTNGKYDVFVRDRGRDLGVGGLAAAGRMSVAGADRFAVSGVVRGVDASDDVAAAVSAQGADLIGAELAYRPATRDLFVRLPVARMPVFALATPAIVYGLDLTVSGRRYELRAAKTGPLSTSYGLFQRVAGNWVYVANLRGGYGTTGQEVVVAVPLRAMGAAHGARISNAVAFTAVADYFIGAGDVLDTITLSR